MFRRVAHALASSSVEAFLAVLCILAGVPILLQPDSLAPGSLLATLPFYMVYVWAGTLTLGGLLTLIGIAWRVYRIEQAGVALLCGMAGVYSLALIGMGSSGTFVAALTYALFSLAMGARYLVLDKLARAMQLAREIHHDDDEWGGGDST